MSASPNEGAPPAVAPAHEARLVVLAAVVVLFAALTVVFAYPLSVQADRVVFGDKPDMHLFIWTLAWDAHAFVTHPFSIFDANIYYPLPRTLAFSENLIGLALFSAPVQWATGNPVLAMNAAALLGCVVGAVGAFVLARRLGFGIPASIVCGLVFGFSPARFLRTGQLHVGAVHWIPFTLAGVHAYLDTGSRRHLRWAMACFSLQALTSGHGAVYLTYAVAGLLAYRALLGEPLAIARRVRDVGVTGALLLSPTVWVTLPYRQVHQDLGFQRWASEWNVNWGSFLASRSHVHEAILSALGASWIDDSPKAYLFPGYVPVLLAVLACVWRRRGTTLRPRDAARVGAPMSWRNRLTVVLEVAAIVALLAAAVAAVTGPIRLRVGDVLVQMRGVRRPLLVAAALLAVRGALLWLVPLQVPSLGRRLRAWWTECAVTRERWRRDPVMFYALFTLVAIWMLLPSPVGLWGYVWPLPGLSSLRVAGRVVVVAVLGLAVLAAAGTERLLAGVPVAARGWVAVALGLLLVTEFAPMPVPVDPFRVEFLEADRYVATRPGTFAIVEFPVRRNARVQTRYMLHAMAHWQKTVHGYSGYEAQMHTALYKQLRVFPDEAGLARLRELGVRYAIVHGGDYPPDEWRQVDQRLHAYGDRLALEFESGIDRVYRLR